LVISFLSVNNQPQAQALNVSNPAINANQTGYTGNGVIVAVIDTGIDSNNPMLQGRILDSVDITGHNDPMDHEGHGTHVAGIVASISDVYPGIAPGASLINVKINESLSIIEDGIQWCIDHKNAYAGNIRIIQMSVGTPHAEASDGTDSRSMKADDAVEAGISVVVAVYDRGGLGNPEQAFNVIAVGAVNDKDTPSISDDNLASYSGHGRTLDGRPKPDVLAPGDQTDDPLVGIWSTRSSLANASFYEAVDGSYGRISGTSMAAPHVSGTIALMLEANPSLTPAQVKAILRQTARLNNDLQGLGVDNRGYGIIDAYAAVQRAQNVGNINKTYMYDSWQVSTPSLDHGLGSNDYLSSTVEAPSMLGINLIDVAYHLRWESISISDYMSVKRMHTIHVWINGTYYDLGADMQEYLLSGPRVYEEGEGYVRMRALYEVGSITITYDWYMHVNAITFSIGYSGGSSWKTLMYIDINCWEDKNYAYLPSTGETVLTERKIQGNKLVDIRDLGHNEYVQMNALGQPNTDMWILRETGLNYFCSDPEFLASLRTYVYNRDVSTYSQSTSNILYVNLVRKTDSLPAPNPVQNDAGCGHDAGNTFNEAVPISPGSYTGILCYSDPTDTMDYYKFNATSGQYIYASMTPPVGIDFALQLYNPSNNPKAGSDLGEGATDSVFFRADSTGEWRIRINITDGEAQYSFHLSVNSNACAMKTGVTGYFYKPNITTNLLKLEMLFDNQGLTGDQTGGTSPYPAVGNYPNGRVEGKDLGFVMGKFGSYEGRSDWDYMADIVPDKKIDGKDLEKVTGNFGNSGNYTYFPLCPVTVAFRTSLGVDEEPVDFNGFVVIPQGTENFTVRYCGVPIGAMAIFWEP
jgi:hypothetical protein